MENEMIYGIIGACVYVGIAFIAYRALNRMDRIGYSSLPPDRAFNKFAAVLWPVTFPAAHIIVLDTKDKRREYWRRTRNDHHSRSDQGAGFSTISTGTIRTNVANTWPGNTSLAARTSTGLDMREVDEPVKGWKSGALILDGRKVAGFVGAYTSELYGLVAEAQCHPSPYSLNPVRSHPDATIPDKNCTCGFYAHQGPYQGSGLIHAVGAGAMQGIAVVLEVELYGKVIVGTNGYRGAKQRIMRVLACKSAFIPRCQAGIPASAAYPYSDVCNRDAHFYMPGGPGGDMPLCGEHAIEYMGKFRHRYYELPDADEVTQPDIAVDWVWLPDPEPDIHFVKV